MSTKRAEDTWKWCLQNRSR